jgi:FlaA1/EpsC-like NDP-sugar epimerase
MLGADRILAMPRVYKDGIMFIHDSVALVFSVYFSSWLTYGDYNIALSKDIFGMLIVFVLTMLVFVGSGLYRSSVRYMGYKAMLSILQATVMLAGILFFLGYVLKTLGISMSWARLELREIAAFWFMITFLLMGSRQGARWLLNTIGRSGEVKSYLVYGAGSAGRQAVSAIVGSKDSMILGFIDDDDGLWGRHINNYPVIGGLDSVELAIKRSRGVTVLLAAPSMSDSRRRVILDYLEKRSIAVRTLPPIRELATGVAKADQIEPIRIEELLGRDPVTLDSKNLSGAFHEKVVLVTGAGGSIGSELCRQIFKSGPKVLLLLDHSEFNLYNVQSELLGNVERSDSVVKVIAVLGSILDQKLLKRIFSSYLINSVYHAAAYKHVPMVEDNVFVGLENNVLGTYNLVAMAHEFRVGNFVNVSTDKAVRPTNVMGATKRLAELVIQGRAQLVSSSVDANKERSIFTMVRFGNVLGSSGSVVPLFTKQIKEKGFVTVTHRDVTRYFMTVSEAAQLVIEAGFAAKGGEVFVLDMGKPIKIDDLARRMIRLSGFTVRDSASGDADDGHSIEIRYTGLRPGEKLYEELILGDGLVATKNPKVFQADEEFLNWPEIEKMIVKIQVAIESCDAILVRTILEEYVTDYCPS